MWNSELNIRKSFTTNIKEPLHIKLLHKIQPLTKICEKTAEDSALNKNKRMIQIINIYSSSKKLVLLGSVKTVSIL